MSGIHGGRREERGGGGLCTKEIYCSDKLLPVLSYSDWYIMYLCLYVQF